MLSHSSLHSSGHMGRLLWSTLKLPYNATHVRWNSPSYLRRADVLFVFTFHFLNIKITARKQKKAATNSNRLRTSFSFCYFVFILRFFFGFNVILLRAIKNSSFSAYFSLFFCVGILKLRSSLLLLLFFNLFLSAFF